MFSVLFRTLIVYVVVVFAMRLMGKRQIGELQPSELVSTFLVSNLASICIEDPELPLTASIVPVFLIASLEIFNAVFCFYSPAYAQLLSGKPVTVIQNGQIDQKALKSLRMNTGDLLEGLRKKDCYDPRQVCWGLVETDGTLSICVLQQGDPPALLPVVIDGTVQTENLDFLQKDNAWLEQVLKKQSCLLAHTVLLLSDGNSVYLIRKRKD